MVDIVGRAEVTYGRSISMVVETDCRGGCRRGWYWFPVEIV